MRQNRTIVLVSRVLVSSLFLAVGISTGLAVEKIVDGVMLEHDESPGGVYHPLREGDKVAILMKHIGPSITTI